MQLLLFNIYSNFSIPKGQTIFYSRVENYPLLRKMPFVKLLRGADAIFGALVGILLPTMVAVIEPSFTSSYLSRITSEIASDWGWLIMEDPKRSKNYYSIPESLTSETM